MASTFVIRTRLRHSLHPIHPILKIREGLLTQSFEVIKHALHPGYHCALSKFPTLSTENPPSTYIPIVSPQQWLLESFDDKDFLPRTHSAREQRDTPKLANGLEIHDTQAEKRNVSDFNGALRIDVGNVARGGG